MRQAFDSATGVDTKLGSARNPDSQDAVLSLANVLPEARFFGGKDILFRDRIEDLALGSPSVWDDQLVVHSVGKTDPERVVATALARGAAGILTEQLLPCPIPQCIVPDIANALARLDAISLNRPDRKMLTVGVFGSAGKTTTSLLLSAVLRQAGIRTAYQNDLGECDGVIQSTSDTPVPSGAPLVRWLNEAVDAESQAAVVELSEPALRQGHYDAIEFDVLVLTGSTHSAGDFGPAGLLCALDRLTSEGVVIASADDKNGLRQVIDSGVRVVSYGMRQSADVTAKIIDQSDAMTTLMVSYDDVTLAMETALCGASMASNHLAAIALGILIDRPLPMVVEAVSAIRSLPGRAQRISQFNAADAIIDVARSPEQVTSSLRAAKSGRGSGRLWCVLAIDENHEDADLEQFGHVMERFADHAIVTSTRDSKSKFLQKSHVVLDGVQSCAAFRMVADQNRAIRWAMQEASQRDTVLVLTGPLGDNAHQIRTALDAMDELVRQSSEEHIERPAFRVISAD